MRAPFPRALALSLALALTLPAAARADSGAYLGYNATLSATAQTTEGYATSSFTGMVQSFGSDGSVNAITSPGSAVGSFGGVNYLTTITFRPTYDMAMYPGSVTAPTFTDASLNLGTAFTAGSAPSVPLTFSLYTGSSQDPLTISNYGSINTQTAYQAILQSSTTLGTATATPGGTLTPGFGATLLQAVNNAAGSGSGSGPLTLVVTAGTSGVGTPAPVAGAGLPFLAAAGAFLARRRRRAALAA